MRFKSTRLFVGHKFFRTCGSKIIGAKSAILKHHTYSSRNYRFPQQEATSARQGGINYGEFFWFHHFTGWWNMILWLRSTYYYRFSRSFRLFHFVPYKSDLSRSLDDLGLSSDSELTGSFVGVSVVPHRGEETPGRRCCPTRLREFGGCLQGVRKLSVKRVHFFHVFPLLKGLKYLKI